MRPKSHRKRIESWLRWIVTHNIILCKVSGLITDNILISCFYGKYCCFALFYIWLIPFLHTTLILDFRTLKNHTIIYGGASWYLGLYIQAVILYLPSCHVCDVILRWCIVRPLTSSLKLPKTVYPYESSGSAT